MQVKFTQIVADAGKQLWALGEDGQIYRLDHFKEKTGETSYDQYGGRIECARYVYYWNKLEFPIGDPRVPTMEK
jgi:hypothetical protein